MNHVHGRVSHYLPVSVNQWSEVVLHIFVLIAIFHSPRTEWKSNEMTKSHVLVNVPIISQMAGCLYFS